MLLDGKTAVSMLSLSSSIAEIEYDFNPDVQVARHH
jgi:hypothetical protein